MKFYDNNGCERYSYLEMLGADIGIGVKKFCDFITKPFKKDIDNEDYDFDELWDEDDLNFYEDEDENESDKQNEDLIIPERDDIFIPGITPKIQYNPEYHITVDPINSKLILHDENGNIVNITRIDPRLDFNQSNIMNILNMVYEDLPNSASYTKTPESTDSEDADKE